MTRVVVAAAALEEEPAADGDGEEIFGGAVRMLEVELLRRLEPRRLVEFLPAR